jgi:hypothetical protein
VSWVGEAEPIFGGTEVRFSVGDAGEQAGFAMGDFR